MRYSLIFTLIFFAGCASDSKKSGIDPEKVSNEAFKRDQPLVASQVPDFYQTPPKSMNPALQDETLDRLNKSELSNVKTGGDSLIEISVLCSKKDFRKAFDIAGRNFDRYQKVPQYWTLVANCHLNQGSHRKALLFYNKALEIKPNYVPALNNIGVMYSRQGLDQKALVAFERAHSQAKFAKTPRYNLSRLYLSYGMAEKAQPLLLGLLNEAPNDVDLLNAVGSSYYLMSNYAQALVHFNRIPQSEWKRAEIGLNLSMSLLKMGKSKDAKKVLSMVSKPSTSTLKKYYASIHNQLGDAK